MAFIFKIIASAACLGLVRATPSAYDNARITCQNLNQRFDSLIFVPGDTEYADLKDNNWSQTAQRNPTCIFRPTSADQLASVLPQLVRADIRFAIRSGGHSPSPTAANIDKGVLIDLGRLNNLSYDAEKQVATLGPGLRWGEAYSQLAEHNVTVVGGRVLEVGVGGLILGSGLSYLSDMYGLACDNVVNFEVVLANGRIVNANQTHNKDLFWALKGGGNNFGIVTSFTLTTYPITQIWGGIRAYTMDDIPALYQAMFEYQSAPNKDPKANLFLQGFISNSSLGVALTLIYAGPENSPAAFSPFYRINATIDTTKISSYLEFLSGQSPPSLPPRIDWRTTTFKPNEGTYGSLSSLTTGSSALRRIKNVSGGAVAFSMQPISTSLVEAGIARGGNALGLNKVNQTWYVIDSGWSNKNDDVVVHSATRDMVKGIADRSKTDGSDLGYIFMNDASYDQNVISQYGADNLAKLRRIARKYDPHQVFQRLVPGGFKLFRTA